jgi:hypothetical protein
MYQTDDYQGLGLLAGRIRAVLRALVVALVGALVLAGTVLGGVAEASSGPVAETGRRHCCPAPHRSPTHWLSLWRANNGWDEYRVAGPFGVQ